MSQEGRKDSVVSLLYSTQRASLANAVSSVHRNDLIRACALAVAPEFNFLVVLMDQNVPDREFYDGSFRQRNDENQCPWSCQIGRIVWILSRLRIF